MRHAWIGIMVGLSLLFSNVLANVLANALAIAAPETSMDSHSVSTEFKRIEQPLAVRLGVTAAGVGLMGLELWWFLWSKPRAQSARAQQGIQELEIAVNGGYEPSQIVVQTGQPVRLNFLRTDPSSCLEQVLIPDFQIARDLPLNQHTVIEFIPKQPGSYPFTCGMNMFRGVIQVVDAKEVLKSLKA